MDAHACRKRELLAEYGAVDESIQESGLLQATVTSATIFEVSARFTKFALRYSNIDISSFW